MGNERSRLIWEIEVSLFGEELLREVAALTRRKARNLAISKRNNVTVKRCAHGRTQRTRRKR